MRPIEFLTHVEQYNAPHGGMMHAILEQNLIIVDKDHKTYKILSYYPTEEGMVLDIERNKK